MRVHLVVIRTLDPAVVLVAARAGGTLILGHIATANQGLEVHKANLVPVVVAGLGAVVEVV